MDWVVVEHVLAPTNNAYHLIVGVPVLESPDESADPVITGYSEIRDFKWASGDPRWKNMSATDIASVQRNEAISALRALEGELPSAAPPSESTAMPGSSPGTPLEDP